MSEPLIEQIGGAAEVKAIVEEMYQSVFQDPELSPFFKDVDKERLQNMQYEFLVSALGGPVNYSGAELQSIHAHRGITAKHYSDFVSHLVRALEARKVDKSIIDNILGTLAMYRDRIIGGSNVDG